MIQLILIGCLACHLATAQCIDGNQALCQSNQRSSSLSYNGFGGNLQRGNGGIRTLPPFNPRCGSNCYYPETCRRLQTVPLPIAEMFDRQPMYSLVLNNNARNCRLDSVCTTFLPVTELNNTYIVYESRTFTDGTNEVISTMATDGGEGETIRSSPDTTVTHRVFGQFEEDTYVICEVLDYGEPTGRNVFAVTFGDVNRNSISQIYQEINRNLLALDGLYVLPYQYPPRCVTQQICTTPNPLLYDQGGYAYSPNTVPSFLYSGRTIGCPAGRC